MSSSLFSVVFFLFFVATIDYGAIKAGKASGFSQDGFFVSSHNLLVLKIVVTQHLFNIFPIVLDLLIPRLLTNYVLPRRFQMLPRPIAPEACRCVGSMFQKCCVRLPNKQKLI